MIPLVITGTAGNDLNMFGHLAHLTSLGSVKIKIYGTRTRCQTCPLLLKQLVVWGRKTGMKQVTTSISFTKGHLSKPWRHRRRGAGLVWGRGRSVEGFPA